MESIDDAGLGRDELVRIARHDRAAFERFFRRYERAVFRFACRMVDDADVAADVTTDVMVEVWRSAARYRGEAKPLTWLLGIAHHKALDRVRARRPTVVELRAAPAADATDEPETAAIAACTRGELESALATLSRDHRAVLHLAFVLQYGQREIATIVGAPLGTVKTRIFHAKRALHRAVTAAAQREIS